MASKITKRDRLFLAPIAELFNGKGWHGKGIPCEEFTLQTVKEAVFPHILVPAGIQMNGKFIETGERYAVATDDGLPVGPAVGDRYWTPQNSELFNLFDTALAGSGYKIVSCITVDNRTEFAIDAKAEHIKAGRRDFAPYVGLHRCFGGLSSLVICGHGTVMQCGNTTALFRREAGKDDDAQSYRNTGGLENRLPEIKAGIERAYGVAAEFALALKNADEIPMKRDDARSAYAGLLTGGKPVISATGNTRTANRITRLVELYAGAGAANNGESVGDWFNAATDYYTHESAGSRDKDTEKQWIASEFGSAREFKSRLAARVFNGRDVNVEAVAEMVSKGRNAIDRTDKTLLAEAGFFN